MSDTTIGHGYYGGIEFGDQTDIPLNVLPDKKQLSAAKGADIVNTLKEDAVFKSVSNGAGIIVNQAGQLLGGQVCWHAGFSVVGVNICRV